MLAVVIIIILFANGNELRKRDSIIGAIIVAVAAPRASRPEYGERVPERDGNYCTVYYAVGPRPHSDARVFHTRMYDTRLCAVIGGGGGGAQYRWKIPNARGTGPAAARASCPRNREGRTNRGTSPAGRPAFCGGPAAAARETLRVRCRAREREAARRSARWNRVDLT